MHHGSRIDSSNPSLFDGSANQSSQNSFRGLQSPFPGVTPTAPNQHHHKPSQLLTEEQKWNTITSEEMHRPSLAKKKTDFDEAIDSIFDGAKTLKQRVNMSMNVLFSSEREIQSFYGSMRSISRNSEAKHAPLYGRGTNSNNSSFSSQLSDNNNALNAFPADSSFSMLPQEAVNGSSTTMHNMYYGLQ
ncbi:hypothetical protein STCU_09966 [Strigomonas culicis]|uniref:Uncharacterized protein n=1 Tax=Strigomonas culicis TaxID=28005 RepID=S9TPR1_9TRYP|nr:hypothetical protein STCU_09966 [Strigomonas culicis]|eukprot:EPY18453.1 hypothetical protein STCU_09966 [Strigomonas culicis]